MPVTVTGDTSGTPQLAPTAYVSINSLATTVVKTGPGVLWGVYVTGAGSATTVNTYDNTAASGTQLTIPAATTTTTGSVATGIPTGIGIPFTNGLTVVTAGTTAGTIMVIYS